MMLLQLSANTGPEECCLAVAKALTYLCQEAAAMGVPVDLLEQVPGTHSGTWRSVLLALHGEHAAALAQRWHGSVQWVCASPYRPGHKRKNWFIGADLFAPDTGSANAGTQLLDKDLRFESLRSSGPGGQQFNTTDSAVRATHIPSGLSVKVQTERSQHANKRLARALLACKLAAQAQDAAEHNRAQRRLQHHNVQRGNAARIFSGQAFRLLR